MLRKTTHGMAILEFQGGTIKRVIKIEAVATMVSSYGTARQ
jgi:hypothetical protein